MEIPSTLSEKQDHIIRKYLAELLTLTFQLNKPSGLVPLGFHQLMINGRIAALRNACLEESELHSNQLLSIELAALAYIKNQDRARFS